MKEREILTRLLLVVPVLVHLVGILVLRWLIVLLLLLLLTTMVVAVSPAPERRCNVGSPVRLCGVCLDVLIMLTCITPSATTSSFKQRFVTLILDNVALVVRSSGFPALSHVESVNSGGWWSRGGVFRITLDGGISYMRCLEWRGIASGVQT